MNPVQIYKLQDAERQKRLEELTNNDNPTALESELGVLRMLHEEALARGEARFAVEILKVMGQLANVTETAKIRRGELLAKAVVLGLAKKMSEALASNVAGKFDGWEDVVEQVGRESVGFIVDARNTEV